MAEPVLVFGFVFETVMPVLDHFVSSTAASMAGIAAAAGTTMFAIYVLFWGIAVTTGQVQEPMIDGFKRIVRGVVILMFATSVGIYMDWVVTFMTEVPGSIATEVVQAGSSGSFDPGAMSSARMLDVALGKGLRAAGEAWSRSATLNIPVAVGYALLGLIIAIFVALVCAYAGALVLMAHMGMSIMLGIGPLFILFAMFEATQQLFVAWTRQVITFAVFFIVLAAAVSLTFSFFTPFLDLLESNSGGAAGASEVVIGGVKLICMAAIGLFVLWQSQSWASGLAGGVSVAAAGAIGRAVTGTTHGAAHRHYDPMKVNKDGSQGGHRWVGMVPSAGRMVASKQYTRDAEGNVSGQWRGAAPAAGRLAAKGAAYMRRNQIKRG